MKIIKIISLFFMILFSTSVFGAELKVGDVAPDFNAQSTSGPVKLSDYSGKWRVLYFYPKAFTPGCTEESCAIRDGYKLLQDAGVMIWGLSLDKLETQQQFREKYKLPFALISDENKEISNKYNVLAFMGLYSQRKTFLINPEGKIAYIFEKVDTSKHDKQILEVLKKLQNKV